MRIGVPKETAEGERRVALVPEVVRKLAGGGHEVVVEAGAGEQALLPDALYTAISPLQGDTDLVTFFVGVDDIEQSIADASRLGGRVVQEPVTVPGVRFALIADPLDHVVGLAQQLEPTG